VTYNICKKGSCKTFCLHLLVHQLNALELALGSRLEVIHGPGANMITHGSYGFIRGVWANGLYNDVKSFAVEVPLNASPSLSLNKWAFNNIGVPEKHYPFGNIETDASSWEP
jgi:hypothetical protein